MTTTIIRGAAAATSTGGVKPKALDFLGKAPGRGFTTIHGPQGSGKTVASVTASRFVPFDEKGMPLLPAPAGRTYVLKDLLVLAYDMGAYDGLASMGLVLPPENIIDARGCLEALGPAKGGAELPGVVEAALKDRPEVEFILHDTISEMNLMWKTEHEAAGVDGDSGLWDRMSVQHRQYVNGMTRVTNGTKARHIFVSHSATRFTTNSETKKQAEAVRVPGMPNVLLDVTGSSRALYTRNASLLLVTKTKLVKGQPTQYNLTAEVSDEWEGKSRYAHLLTGLLPPSLRYIYRKIGEVSE